MITLISVTTPPQLKVIVPSRKVITVLGTGGPTGPAGPQGPTGATGAAGATDSNRYNVTQTAHGFVVGDVLRIQNSATTYLKALADTAENAEVVGIVSAVTDSSHFTLLTSGRISGLSGLTKGSVYFLSSSIAGSLITSEPIPNGARVSKPVLIADSTTSGFFINHRGFIKYA